MVINLTYFTGKIAIGQISQPDVSENVQRYIDTLERDYLKGLLGIELADLVIESVELIDASDSDVDSDVVEDRMLQLILGTKFECKGKKREWIGFRNELKRSPIANYIWIEYEGDKASFSAGIGTAKPKAENATVVHPIRVQVPVWNEMVDWQDECLLFITSSGLFPEYECQKPMVKQNHFGI